MLLHASKIHESLSMFGTLLQTVPFSLFYALLNSSMYSEVLESLNPTEALTLGPDDGTTSQQHQGQSRLQQSSHVTVDQVCSEIMKVYPGTTAKGIMGGDIARLHKRLNPNVVLTKTRKFVVS